MADNYTAPSGSPDLPWLYRRSDDQPVGVVAPNGKEVLFGGSTATDTVAREMATAASTAASAASASSAAAVAAVAPLTPAGKAEAWTYGSWEKPWSQMIEGLPLTEWEVFGSGQYAPPGGKAYTDATSLATGYQPLMRVENTSGQWLDGTDSGVINDIELHRYRPSFSSSQNHIFGSDYLSLQPTIDAGHTFELGPVGEVQAGGVRLNMRGSAVTTPLANTGWVSGDLSSIGVGRCVSSPNGLGLAVITQQSASTMTFEWLGAASIGPSPDSLVTTTQLAMEVMPYYAARSKQALIKNVTQSILHETPVHANVVPGMWVAIVINGWVPYASGYARVQSVSGDRRTVTFTEPVGMDYDRPADTDVGRWVLYYPPIWSAQIGSYKVYTPHWPGRKAHAMEVEFSLPKVVSTYDGSDIYTRAGIAAMKAANPDFLPGVFDADWYFMTRRDPNNRNALLSVSNPNLRWPEIDRREGWTKRGNGSMFHTNSNFHSWDGTQTATRRVAHGIAGDFIEGSQASFTSASEKMLRLYQSLFDGRRHKLRSLWTQDGRYVSWMDDMLMHETTQAIAMSYGYQHILNHAVGGMSGNYPLAGFNPWKTSDIARMHFRIYSKRVWEL